MPDAVRLKVAEQPLGRGGKIRVFLLGRKVRGSFDCVRLAPHSAQDDNEVSEWGLIGVHPRRRAIPLRWPGFSFRSS
jgi:hypothetical protein